MLKFLTSLLLFIFTISFSTYTLIFLPFPSQLTLLFIYFFTISFSNLYSTISFLYHNHLFPLQRFTATTFYHLFSPHLFATFFHHKHHHRHHLSLPPSLSTTITFNHHHLLPPPWRISQLLATQHCRQLLCATDSSTVSNHPCRCFKNKKLIFYFFYFYA